jgi:hypothetical protein
MRENRTTADPNMQARKRFDALILLGVAIFILSSGVRLRADGNPAPAPILGTAPDQGFAGLYNLDFAGAQKDFQTWETNIPMIRWGR